MNIYRLAVFLPLSVVSAAGFGLSGVCFAASPYASRAAYAELMLMDDPAAVEVPELPAPSRDKGAFNAQGRPLTAGERELLEKIFAKGVDYGKVRIYNRRWSPLQPDNAAMSPDGNIYYPESRVGRLYYSGDFSKLVGPTHKPLRDTFIHEMSHVYQYQQGVSVVLRRIVEGDKYRYKIIDGKDLNDYTVEQQAEIIKDFYLCLVEKSWDRAYCVLKFVPALDNFDEDPNYLREAELRRRQRQPF